MKPATVLALLALVTGTVILVSEEPGFVKFLASRSDKYHYEHTF